LNYLIVGTGGTGGCIGGFLAAGGQNVTFIARGAHYEAMRDQGLVIHTFNRGDIALKPVKACEKLEGGEKFDVIFVCVKGYSLDGIVPLLQQASHGNTVIIPILNSLSAGERLGEDLPGITVLGGCVYVSAYLSAPGEIRQGIPLFRLVFGQRDGLDTGTAADGSLLRLIREDLEQAGIECVISDDIRRDVFRKFSFTSACAAVGAYYDIAAGAIQQGGEPKEMFIALLKELDQIADAMHIRLNGDWVDENLVVLNGLAPDTTVSMQKDLKAGKASETDVLIVDVVRIADKFGVDAPNYRKVAAQFGYQPA